MYYKFLKAFFLKKPPFGGKTASGVQIILSYIKLNIIKQ